MYKQKTNSGVSLNTVVTKDGVYVLDLAAKIDATADYICKVKWGDVEFPPPFGREAYPEASKESTIAQLMRNHSPYT